MFRFSKNDYQKFFFYKKFHRLDFKDSFFFQTTFKSNLFFKKTKFYIYSGKFWFRFKNHFFKQGFSLNSFIVTKQVAIYKKKQYLKKKKK